MTGPDGRDRGDQLDPGRAAEHARFEFDDAAYLLGALDLEQRQAFEQHLARCPICRDRVADVGDLPPVLARADVSAWEPEFPPDTLLPRLLRQVTASRRRRAWRISSLAVAAACLLALLATGGVLGWQHAHRPQTLAMQPVGPNAAGVHATVQLTGSGSSTRVKLACGYSADSGSYQHDPATSYRMVIFNRRGERVDLGSWTPQPDEDVQITRTSPWPRQSISLIEVSDDHGQTVLRLRL
ncbi:MAG: zf-HC2 domain-containing protein [Jatrophihabitantaceae bacterium]